MADDYKTRVDDVRKKVSIPQYFYNIIVPQLGSYYDDYPVDFDARPVVCCPLHDENTPSMRFYEETNTFYCFGCRKGGDIIHLHRLFTERQTGSKPTFSESVNFLYDYFIKGNESALAVQTVKHLVEPEEKSSNVDKLRYSGFTSILEGQLLVDNSVSEEAKRKIWRAMDDTEVLIDKNKINALDAMSYIKSVVSENCKLSEGK